jgi:non-canonical purine NTP pyrophosphatase (RdgB/HAM1 family)
MQVIFATSNIDKVREAKEILGIDIVSTSLEIPEIQSLDPIKVAMHKAKSYFSVLSKPLFVEDVSLCFTALNGLPGPYINDFSHALGNSGLIKLLNNQPDHTCTAVTTLAFCDSIEHVEIFQGKVAGSVSTEILGNNGFGWDQIFIPEGQNKTFAQMSSTEKNSLSMRTQALKSFKTWLDSTGILR